MKFRISSQKNDEESRTKYHKDRQFEQQRHKLQAVGQTVPGGRQFAQSQRDAMIAQIIGPLPGARHSDSVTHQPPGTNLFLLRPTNFMFYHVLR